MEHENKIKYELKQIDKELKNSIRKANKQFGIDYDKWEKRRSICEATHFAFINKIHVKFMDYNLTNNVPIYYSGCYNDRITKICYNDEINLMLVGYGDYEINIYKINKSSERAELKNMLTNYSKNNERDRSCTSYEGEIKIYNVNNFFGYFCYVSKRNKCEYCDCFSSEKNDCGNYDGFCRYCFSETNHNNEIDNMYENFMFETIFNKKFHQLKKFTDIDSDGNVKRIFVEFDDAVYYILYSTS